MPKIKNITAREILDSRGNPTVETRIELDNGVSAKASVPSGASTGIHEAYELRDGDKTRYGGKGVLKAIESVNKTIFPALKGREIDAQREIDKKMIELDKADTFELSAADSEIAIGLIKGSKLKDQINEILSGITEEERIQMMDEAIKNQPSAE